MQQQQLAVCRLRGKELAAAQRRTHTHTGTHNMHAHMHTLVHRAIGDRKRWTGEPREEKVTDKATKPHGCRDAWQPVAKMEMQ